MANHGTHVNNDRPRFVSNDNIGLATINSDAVDKSVARVFIRRPLMAAGRMKSPPGCIEILYFDDPKSAYVCWLGCDDGVFAAMRNANEKTPVYFHDFVDQH